MVAQAEESMQKFLAWAKTQCTKFKVCMKTIFYKQTRYTEYWLIFLQIIVVIQHVTALKHANSISEPWLEVHWVPLSLGLSDATMQGSTTFDKCFRLHHTVHLLCLLAVLHYALVHLALLLLRKLKGGLFAQAGALSKANVVVMGQDEFHDALESAAESVSIASSSGRHDTSGYCCGYTHISCTCCA